MNKFSSYKRIMSLVLSVLMIAAMLSVSAVEKTKIIMVDGQPTYSIEEFHKDSVNVTINLETTDTVQVTVNGQDVILNENNGFTLTVDDITNTGKEDATDSDTESDNVETPDATDSDTESDNVETPEPTSDSDEKESGDDAQSDTDSDKTDTSDTAETSDTADTATTDTPDLTKGDKPTSGETYGKGVWEIVVSVNGNELERVTIKVCGADKTDTTDISLPFSETTNNSFPGSDIEKPSLIEFPKAVSDMLFFG